jgi:hypothetical protein
MSQSHACYQRRTQWGFKEHHWVDLYRKGIEPQDLSLRKPPRTLRKHKTAPNRHANV